METEQKVNKSVKRILNLENGAKVAMAVLLLDLIRHLAAVYQTRYQLVSPLIPESIIWDINKHFISRALVSAIASIIGLFFYFSAKYLLVIILVTLIIIGIRFIYV